MNMPKLNFKDQKIQIMIFIIILGLGGSLAWYYMVYAVKQVTLSNLQSTEQTKQNELNSILAMKPQLNKLREDIARANARLDSLKSIFPDHKEIPRLIQDITKVAVAAGIETKKFSPLPDVEREYYIENRYDIAIVGGYHQVATFFSYLANMQLLVNLSDVNITVSGDLAKSMDAAEENNTPPQSINAVFSVTLIFFMGHPGGKDPKEYSLRP